MSIIRVTFEGMLVLFLNNARRYCHVGILKNAPNHDAKLVATKIPSGGAPEEMARLGNDNFAPQLWLDVQKSTPKIELTTDGSAFTRLTHHADSDFRWAIDFEGDDLYKHPIRTDMAGFSSVLQINDGKFSTQQISNNQLTKRQGNSTQIVVGKVATKLVAAIALSANDKAELWNGETDLPLATFENVPSVDYGIYLGKTRGHHHAEDSEVIDANHYYTALGSDIAPGRKYYFDREPSSRIDPDAVCLPAWMGTTELK